MHIVRKEVSDKRIFVCTPSAYVQEAVYLRRMGRQDLTLLLLFSFFKKNCLLKYFKKIK